MACHLTHQSTRTTSNPQPDTNNITTWISGDVASCIMNQAYELSTLTRVVLLVVAEIGLIYTFTHEFQNASFLPPSRSRLWIQQSMPVLPPLPYIPGYFSIKGGPVEDADDETRGGRYRTSSTSSARVQPRGGTQHYRAATEHDKLGPPGGSPSQQHQQVAGTLSQYPTGMVRL